uniref:Elongation factor Ts, mitochondrial n=1 Tax=Parascaris univalens TaxID=6257 RepID=A0A915A8E4_PARUN
MKYFSLSHRQVKNGLVSVITDGNTAAVVEVNCETDFVTRGTDFRNLVERITRSALLASKEYAATSSASGERFVVKSKPFDSLKSASGDTSLKEALTSVIGKLGENITVSKVQLIVADPGVALFGYAHPREGTSHVDMGKFVSVVGLRRLCADSFPIEKLGEQICQHVVGMRSETLGPPIVEVEGSNKVERLDGGSSEKVEDSEADE